jgi:ribose/xylose/arabinose/galactoside ABC-type transport system permease subunit
MKTAFGAALKKLFDNYTRIIILLALIILFSFFSPHFFTFTNLRNLITQNTYYIIAAVGLAFVMIGGGIDLSVGYQMSLVGVVFGILINVAGFPVPLALVAGFMLGAALGALNGIIVTSIRIFPLIATLATSAVFQGISYTFSQSKTYRPFPSSFRAIAIQNIAGIPLDVFLVLVIALVAAYILQKTYFGRYVMAVGGNEEVARLSGVNTKLIKTILYGICGFCFAIATWVMVAKSNTANSSTGPGTEFTGLTAAIIGGISFKGGKGTIPGLIIGVFIVQIIGNGMQLAGWGVYSQYIVKGIILLMAVALDSLKNK